MLDALHTSGGHRIRILVESTWLPPVDRNPQTFVDIGVLYGIADSAARVSRAGLWAFRNIASTAGHKTVVNQSVYSGTKFAVG